MSEKVYKHHNHEQERSNHELEDHNQEILKNLAEKGREAAHEHAENIKDNLEDIRAEALEKSTSTEQVILKQEQEAKEPDTLLLIGKDLKTMKYKRTLKSVQKDLKPAERVLSKVMHNEKVDAASEIAGKTIARPSGFLTGAIFAFVGSSAFLWISKHYGYQYNFLLFVMFFVAGFAIGLLGEGGVRLLHRRKA